MFPNVPEGDAPPATLVTRHAARDAAARTEDHTAMGKLVDKLEQIGQATGSGFGFLGGRAPARKPRPAAVFVALGTGDAASAEAAAKNGADGVILTDWAPGADLGAIKAALGDKGAIWGVELGADAAVDKEMLKGLADAGAGFAIVESSASARALFAKVEKFDLVAAMAPPKDDMALLLIRGQSLLPVRAALLRADLGARDVARLSVAEYARLRLVVESLRFPALLTLKEAPEEADVATLVHLGADGLVVAGKGSAAQLGAQVKALIEALEKTPTPKEERANVLLGGLSGGAGQPAAPGQPQREPEQEPEQE